MNASTDRFTGARSQRITEEWAGCFPSFGIYKPRWLLRRVGPLLEGILLERDGGNAQYLPTFHVHCLLRDSSNISLTLKRTLLTERTSAPDKVSVASHEERYREAAERLQRQVPLPLSGDLRLDQVLDAYRAYDVTPGRHYWEYLYEDAVAICACAGQKQRAAAILDEAAIKMLQWPEQVQNQLGGIPTWRKKIESRLLGENDLRALADARARLWGVQDLPTAELIT